VGKKVKSSRPLAKRVLTPDERWTQGVEHDDRSVKLIDALKAIDEKHNEGRLDIRTGGDGDNGEDWAYLLDIFFEQGGKL